MQWFKAKPARGTNKERNRKLFAAKCMIDRFIHSFECS